MNCINHVNIGAVAIITRSLEKNEGMKMVRAEFQVGLCLKCCEDWVDDLGKEGFK